MNKHEASEWVHVQLIVGEMVFDDLVAAFTALAGHVPGVADRPDGLFRRCCEIVTASGGVASRRHVATAARARKPCVN